MAFALFSHLMERRVPHILGLYLAASWIVVEFVNLLVDRFALSPHLIGLSMVGCGLLIPSVLMLAYNHGKPGRQDWSAAEKVGIPLNFLVAAAIVVVVFSDRPLGATTTTLTLQTEEGGTVERVVPKSEFRKSVLVFGFENQSGDSTLAWLQLGIRLGLIIDLQQDIYLQVGGGEELQASLQRVGHPLAVGMSVPLMANIAREQHQDYFTFGSYTHEGDELVVDVSLYETRRQRRVSERTYTGKDIGLVDAMTVQLRRDVGVPERHIEETKDLPVADILTRDPEALKYLVLAFNETITTNDWVAARDYLERSVAVDPTAVFAQYYLAVTYLILNEAEKADSAAEMALRYLYKLPESWQYDVRYVYYEAIRPDPVRRFRIAEARARLFPEDVQGHATLAREYRQRNEIDKAIAEYELILELAPTQYEYLREIGSIYRGRQEFEPAVDYFERYIAAVPDDPSGLRALGAVHCDMGEHERGKAYFEQALALDPDNVGLLSDLATAEFNLGRFDEALAQFEDALAVATTAQDRVVAFWRLSRHAMLRGRPAESIEYKEREWRERERYNPAALVMTYYKLPELALYVAAGREERAFEILRTAETELAEPLKSTLPASYLGVYLELKDADRAEQALADFERYVEREAAEGWRGMVLDARGQIHEMRGEYREATESYRSALEFNPNDVYVKRRIARCHRLLGQFGESETYLKEHLTRTPFNPDAHHEMALLYAEIGEREKALEHLRVALEVWSEAEPGFGPAREAAAKMAELQAPAAS